MNVEIERAQMVVDGNEIREIYYALRRCLEEAIDRHWVNHPDAFERNAALKLSLLRHLAGYAGWDASEEIQKLKARLAAAVEAKGVTD